MIIKGNDAGGGGNTNTGLAATDDFYFGKVNLFESLSDQLLGLSFGP